MKKEINLDKSKILYQNDFTSDEIFNDWESKSGEWWIEDNWLFGKNPGNFPGMIVSKQNFPGNVLVEFEAATVEPCTHDINFMWNGSWDEVKNERGVAYVAGLQGWWEGKVGIEKSPQYKLNIGTPLFNFNPGQIYKIQGGSIDGHCFIFADGQLLLEATDPDPIDHQIHTKVSFEAYCSFLKIRNVSIRQIDWNLRELSYTPEF